ncbi:MAG: BON domain-containing protein [Acidobacteriota bacterium]
MVRRLVSLVALVALVAAVPAVAAADEPRKDLQIFRDISDQVHRYTRFTIFDSVSASVTDGRVVLTGWVTMPYKKDDIEERARKVAGVSAIENRIEVLPVSPFDDELRFRIARAIYGNSSFWHYASMVNPPIHIVVNRGRVTLQGVVQNNVERQLARSLASGFGAFEVTSELRTDEEVRAELEKALD